MPVKVVGRKQINRVIQGTVSVSDLRKMLELRDDQYVPLVNGTPATDDDSVTDTDDVVFLEVFSGG